MKTASFLTLLIATIMTCQAHAELVNDFDCTLNEGQNTASLYQFQAQWMAAARQAGFDESYKTRILFPVYNERTGTKPLYFIWRGFFKDGDQWGKMTDWFFTSQWTAKFDDVMNCTKASLWTAPQ